MSQAIKQHATRLCRRGVNNTAIARHLGAGVEIAKRNELHTFAVIPKRWGVECSFAWLEKCRKLWKNCERKLNTSLQF